MTTNIVLLLGVALGVALYIRGIVAFQLGVMLLGAAIGALSLAMLIGHLL